MANPLDGPPLVIISCQPVGEVTPLGLTGMKLSPGTQANQNVPSVVVPVSLSVRLYLNCPGPSGAPLIVAVAISEPLDVAVASRPAKATVVNAKNERIMTSVYYLQLMNNNERAQ